MIIDSIYDPVLDVKERVYLFEAMFIPSSIFISPQIKKGPTQLRVSKTDRLPIFRVGVNIKEISLGQRSSCLRQVRIEEGSANRKK